MIPLAILLLIATAPAGAACLLVLLMGAADKMARG